MLTETKIRRGSFDVRKIIVACFLIISGLSLNAAARTEIVSVLEAVRIKNDKRAEALYFYEKNWKALREEALKKGYIHSFELIEVVAGERNGFDLILITRYENRTQFDKSEENFQALIKQQGSLKLLNDLKPGDFRESVFSITGKSAIIENRNW